jgi:hypothetical protein
VAVGPLSQEIGAGQKLGQMRWTEEKRGEIPSFQISSAFSGCVGSGPFFFLGKKEKSPWGKKKEISTGLGFAQKSHPPHVHFPLENEQTPSKGRR